MKKITITFEVPDGTDQMWLENFIETDMIQDSLCCDELAHLQTNPKYTIESE